ncbi:MAG: single-stranded DNA-binding protein [Pirellulaceae bacterium]|nr:single-stranded DNA-binding protein [Pirellulaceae bacterium]
MASYNRVILMGNLTRDIVLRYTPAGTPVTEVGLAINDRRKGQNGEWIDETTFVDVTFWGRTAEVAAEYLSKGSPVFIEGHLKLDKWEKDGQKNYKLRVVCDRMQMIGARGEGGGPRVSGAGSGSVREEYAEARSATIDSDSGHGGGYSGDDIPF